MLVVVFPATHALVLTRQAGGSAPDLYLPAAGWSTFTGVIALVLLVGLVVTSLVGRLTYQTFVLVQRLLRVDRLSSSGDWNTAIRAAEEARRLAAELGEPQWSGGGDAVESLIAGMRGDAPAAERPAARAEQIGVEAQANVVVALALPGRVLAMLGASRHGEAFEIAERLFDRADLAFHHAMRCWLIGDLAEAALGTDRREYARARRAEVEAAVGESPETWIALELRTHARCSHQARTPPKLGSRKRSLLISPAGLFRADVFSSPTGAGCAASDASSTRGPRCGRLGTYSTRSAARAGPTRRAGSYGPQASRAAAVILRFATSSLHRSGR